MEPRPCEECGKDFMPRVAKQKYCKSCQPTKQCRQLMDYQKSIGMTQLDDSDVGSTERHCAMIENYLKTDWKIVDTDILYSEIRPERPTPKKPRAQ